MPIEICFTTNWKWKLNIVIIIPGAMIYLKIQSTIQIEIDFLEITPIGFKLFLNFGQLFQFVQMSYLDEKSFLGPICVKFLYDFCL